jgi:hypothetical protein
MNQLVSAHLLALVLICNYPAARAQVGDSGPTNSRLPSDWV